MNNQEFNEKAHMHGEIIAEQKEILEKVRNLAWKQAQPNNWTEERQSRINVMSAKYHELSRKSAAVWSN